MLHVKTTLWSSHFEKVSCGRYWGGEGRTLGNWLAGWWFGWCVAVEVVTCLAYVLDRCVFCLFVILGVSEIGCFFLHIVHWLPRFRISLEVEKVSSLFLVIYQYIYERNLDCITRRSNSVTSRQSCCISIKYRLCLISLALYDRKSSMVS